MCILNEIYKRQKTKHSGSCTVESFIQHAQYNFYDFIIGVPLRFSLHVCPWLHPVL